MSTMFDVEPLWRTGIGFDRMLDVLGQMTSENPTKYPPYDIERTGDDAYRLTLAVAGWSRNEITVTTESNQLVISGNKRVADIYFGEFMRIFDHIYARYIVEKMKEAGTQDPEAGFLKETAEEWVPQHFKPGRKQLRRLYLMGA